MINGLLIASIIILEFMTPKLLNAKGHNKYAITTINIRAKPNTKSKIVGRVYWNDKINVIKKITPKWYQIKYKKKIRYICAAYIRSKNAKYKNYSSPSASTFKTYEDAACITNDISIAQGKLKQEYHLDYHSGIYMVGNRYCIAVGSFYTNKVGVKIDLVLSPKGGRKHTLKCITADCKADKDTINNHKIHNDGSIIEFIVNTRHLSPKVKIMGDVSYAGKKFKGKIEKIRVYK